MDTFLGSENDPGLRLLPSHNVIVRIANKGIRMRNCRKRRKEQRKERRKEGREEGRKEGREGRDHF